MIASIVIAALALGGATLAALATRHQRRAASS
jgi:hypothetical protein